MSQHTHDHAAFDDPAMVLHAVRDGEAMLPLTADAIGRVRDTAAGLGLAVRRILDLGSGPGVGTCALATAFPTADVVAVDSAPTTLATAQARAASEDLSHRVVTMQVDLPGGLPTLGRADLAWASMSLHHLGDERAALQSIRDLLAPSGLLALVERARPTRPLLDGSELGDLALWGRVDAAWSSWFAEMREGLPGAVESGDLSEMVSGAGFEVLVDDVLEQDIPAPPDSAARRYLVDQASRMSHQLVDHLGSGDLRAIERIASELDHTAQPLRIHAARRFVLARVGAAVR